MFTSGIPEGRISLAFDFFDDVEHFWCDFSHFLLLLVVFLRLCWYVIFLLPVFSRLKRALSALDISEAVLGVLLETRLLGLQAG